MLSCLVRFTVSVFALAGTVAGHTAWASSQPWPPNARTATPRVVTFRVDTADGLALPARVAMPNGRPRKVVVFINGSTPSDEAGHMAAMFDTDGRPFRGRHGTYVRFLEVLPARGYAVASMAKRSYTYPHRLPRPGLDDFALDILALIDQLKRRGMVANERDLIIVGYSEGSLVAAKAAGRMTTPPAGVVLLGSATGAIDFATTTLEQWPYADVHRARGWTDDRIRREFERQREFASDVARIDETSFEQVWKKDDRRGIAPWESYAVARETRLYDPVPDLRRANAPVLFCIGDRDATMPVALARGVFTRLAAAGSPAMFRVLPGEVHQYLGYEVFLVLDAWIASAGRTADFVPTDADRAALERASSLAALQQSIGSLPWTGEPARALASLAQARALGLDDARLWFKLGMLMTDAGRWDDALSAFGAALSAEHDAPHGPLTWAGHVSDLKGDRAGAIGWYRKALAAYNGIPLRHDHLGITIDRAWIERRLQEPFTSSPGRAAR